MSKRNKYRLPLPGKNLLLKFEGKLVKGGCFATRFIEAKNPLDAERKAVQAVWKELTPWIENSNDPIPVKTEEIFELASFGTTPVPGKGFTFYTTGRRIQRKKAKRRKK